MNLNTNLNIIGYTAGVLIIISFIPQLITIIQNKTSHNVSFSMYTISLISQVLWISYGLLKWDMAVLATNLGTIMITILIICFSLYYKINDNKKDSKSITIEQNLV